MAKLTHTEITRLRALFLKMDRDDLDHVVELHKARSRNLITLTAMKFTVGDTVQFTSGARLIEGIVEKVNRKTINVSTHTQKWRVSPSLLTKVA
jgi:uncharacterized protein YkvS